MQKITQKAMWLLVAAASISACSAAPTATGGDDEARYHVDVLRPPMGGGDGGCCGGMGSSGENPGGYTPGNSPVEYQSLNDDIVNVRALSQPGHGPSRALGGGTDMEWASAGYKRPNAEYKMEFRNTHDFHAIDLKTGPTKGSYYMAYASDDGRNWRVASSRIEASDWGVHSYELFGAGRYLKLHWFNTGNVDHAAIFSLQVKGDIATYGRSEPTLMDPGAGYQDVSSRYPRRRRR